MDWGNTLEETILVQACKRLGLDVKDLTTKHPKPYFHKDLPFACSLDGDVKGNDSMIMTDLDKGIICVNEDEIRLEGVGIVEAKLTAHEVESADQLPLYRGPLQLQMQMDTVGATWGAVCVLYRGTTLRTFVYQRDVDVLAQIHEAINDFQRRLDKYKTNDEIEWYDIKTPSEASSIFDQPDKDEIEIPEAEHYAEKIIEFRDMIKDLEEQIDLHQIQIMNFMRDNQHAISGRYKISWPVINYKAQPEKIVKAKEARTIRQSKLRIRDREF